MWRLQPLTGVAFVVDGGGVRQPPPRLVRVRPRTARRRTARPATDHCPPKLRDRRRPDELRHRPRRGALCPRSHRRPRSLRQRTALECLPNGWSSGAAGAWRPRKRLSCTSKLSQAFVPGSCELTVTWPASGPLGGLLPKKPGQEWLPHKSYSTPVPSTRGRALQGEKSFIPSILRQAWEPTTRSPRPLRR